MTFNIRKFDMKMLVDRCAIDSHKSPMIVFIGKKDTGKSFLLKDVLFYTKDCFPIGTVISGSEVANGFFQEIVPSKLIYDKYKPEIVESIIRRQMMIKQMRASGKTNQDPRAFLVLDDCLYDNTWIQQESTRYVFMNGRHVDLATMITMQYPLGVSPNLRTNIDFVFILRENILGNRKRIYENYAGMFPSFEMFCQFMDQCTENYECLVIANCVQSNKLEDQVFWYKSGSHDSFQVCDRSMWVDNKPFTSTLLQSGEFNIMDYRKKNKGPDVWVKKDGRS